MKIYDQQLAESLQAKEAAQTSEASQTRSYTKLPNFIQKDDCTANSPDLKTCGVSLKRERTKI